MVLLDLGNYTIWSICLYLGKLYRTSKEVQVQSPRGYPVVYDFLGVRIREHLYNFVSEEGDKLWMGNCPGDFLISQRTFFLSRWVKPFILKLGISVLGWETFDRLKRLESGGNEFYSEVNQAIQWSQDPNSSLQHFGDFTSQLWESTNLAIDKLTNPNKYRDFSTTRSRCRDPFEKTTGKFSKLPKGCNWGCRCFAIKACWEKESLEPTTQRRPNLFWQGIGVCCFHSIPPSFLRKKRGHDLPICVRFSNI